MKRAISATLALLLILCLFACGADEPAHEESASAPAESEAESSALQEESSEEPGMEESSEETSIEESSEEISEEESSEEISIEESSEEPSVEESSEEPSVEESSEEPSVEESSEEPSVEESSEEPSTEESSEEPSVEESSEEPSVEESSEEPSEEVSVEALEMPTVFGCTRLYDNSYVILGHCVEGAVIYYEANGTKYSTGSDHGWFSARIKYRSSYEKVRLWAKIGDAVSPVKEFLAQPKSVGSDKWDIIAGKDYQFHLDYTLQDYLHTNLYTQSQMNALVSTLKNRDERTDAEIIYIVVPSPASVYPETMPDVYAEQQNGDVSKYDQLMEVLENAGVTYINVKELFAQHKDDGYKLYWKTDSHWSEYGAYLVYKELFDHISQKFPQSSPRAFDEFEWKEGTFRGGDMAYYLEYDDEVMSEYNVARIPLFDMPRSISQVRRYVSESKLTYDSDTMPAARTINTGRAELPSAMVLRDSYSTQIYDILAERFDKTVYKSMWSFSFNAQEVKSSGVDYVIYILTERNIGSAFR
jgi:hypothetical protein